MKILYHHRTAAQDGSAVHITEMIAALRERGHEVRVVAPGVVASEGRDAAPAKPGWLAPLRRHLPKAVYELLELGYSLIAYRRLVRVAQEFKPDALYERYNLFLLSGVWLRRRLGLPMLLEVNAPLANERQAFGGLALPRLARWAERTAWRGADKVLPVTQVLADLVARQGVPEDRLAVIPNGINEAHFAHAPAAAVAKAKLGLAGALVLGFTGYVRDWHGVDRVLHWMASDAAPAAAVLLLVGDGPARPGLEQQARELGIAHRLRITGFVAREEVPGLVAAFDIALQPAVTAYASPLKLFEYLALGKAIVAPRVPNIEEILVDGKNAVLFDQCDPGSLATALTRLGADVELRGRLGLAARATIGELGLTWQANARRVEALFDGLRQGATPPPVALGQVKAP